MVQQAPVVPSNLRLCENGKLFTFTETLQLIKKGVKIPSNTRFDPAFVGSFDKFPQEIQSRLRNNTDREIATTTLVAKRQSGKLGEKLVLTDDLFNAVLIVNKVFQNERSLAIDLTKDNFEFEVVPGRAVRIFLTQENEVKPLYLATDRCSRVASEQTLYLPLDENAPYPQEEFVWRRFESYTMSGDFLSLAARGLTDVWVNGKCRYDDIALHLPSRRMLLVEEIMPG